MTRGRRYADQPSIMAVFAKMRKLHAVLLPLGGPKATLDDVRRCGSDKEQALRDAQWAAELRAQLRRAVEEACAQVGTSA